MLFLQNLSLFGLFLLGKLLLALCGFLSLAFSKIALERLDSHTKGRDQRVDF
jgi:hypothetical protein